MTLTNWHDVRPHATKGIKAFAPIKKKSECRMRKWWSEFSVLCTKRWRNGVPARRVTRRKSHLAGVSLAAWLQRLNATIGRLVLGSARFRNMFLLGTLVNSVNPKPSTLNVRAWALGFGPHRVRMFWSFGSGFASCNP